MSDLKSDDLQKQWRQDLLNLKEKVKQKIFDNDQALTIAEEIKDGYKGNFVKPNYNILNAHIQLCKTLEQGKKILTQYTNENVQLTTTTFNIFISLSPDLVTAFSYFEQIFDNSLLPNSYTLNGLISKCYTLNQGQQIIKSMIKYDISPNIQTYNTLLSLTNKDEERKEILRTMEDRQIGVNLVTYNTLISKSTDYDQALMFYSEMKSRQIKPSINTLVTLLKKTRSQKEINKVEQLLENENIDKTNIWRKLYNRKNRASNV